MKLKQLNALSIIIFMIYQNLRREFDVIESSLDQPITYASKQIPLVRSDWLNFIFTSGPPFHIFFGTINGVTMLLLRPCSMVWKRYFIFFSLVSYIKRN